MAPPQVQKITSTLSPDLKKLSVSYLTPKTKIAQSLGKPSASVDYFDKYMQIRGNKVVVDITVREDLSTAKAELQKLGATVTAMYGRMISALVPISALAQLEGSASIRFARPAYRPMHQGGNAAVSRGGVSGDEVSAGSAALSWGTAHTTAVHESATYRAATVTTFGCGGFLTAAC